MTDLFRPVTLPEEYDQMDKFISNNKVKLMEQVVTSIQYAMDNNLSSVEVFKFKNSSFIVMLEYSTFKSNIDNIFDYYVESEQYELCGRVQKLKKLLEHHDQI